MTFDLWETLFMDDPEQDRHRDHLRCQQMHDVLLRYGIDIPTDQLTRGLRESATWLVSIWEKGDQVPTMEQVRFIIHAATDGRATIPSDASATVELEEAYANPGLRTPPTLNAHAVPVLRELRQRGYKIGLICNVGRGPARVLRQLMRNLGILEYFDATLFSDEVGHGKPDERIFQAAAEKLGVPITEILHVGDNPRADVWGPKQAGMSALLFQYEVPSGFKENPVSLFALTRAEGSGERRLVEPDGRISSLNEVLQFLKQR